MAFSHASFHTAKSGFASHRKSYCRWSVHLQAMKSERLGLQEPSTSLQCRVAWLVGPTEAASATHMENSRSTTLLIVTELSWPHTIACAVSPGLRTQGPGGNARGIWGGAGGRWRGIAGRLGAGRGCAARRGAARSALQGRSSRAYGLG